MTAVDECWEKGKDNWDKVTPQKYQTKKKLVYNKECGYFYSGNLRRSYFGLTNGNILIVDQKRISPISDEVVNVYHLYVAELDEWFEIDINTFEDDCLSCDFNYIAAEVTKLAGKTVGRYILPIEDFYILLEGRDFDGVQANRAVAGGFILIEFIPGGKVLKPVTKGLKAGIKATVKGSRKIYKTVKGSKVVIGEFADDVLKPAKWIDGEVDEIVEILEDVNYTTSDGQQVKGALQLVKKGDNLGFRLAKFTTKEVNELVQAATKNPESKKIILGKYVKNSPLSYDKVAGKEYTYFNLDNWEDVSKMFAGSYDEMWKINKQFIDNQIKVGKDIFFSHDPQKEIDEVDYSFFLREIEYLMDLGCKNFEKVGDNLWKAVWQKTITIMNDL